MSKPILEVRVTTTDERAASVNAVLDSGSFYSIMREDALPHGSSIMRYGSPKEFETAGKGGRIHAIGELILIVTIGKKSIRTAAFVSPELSEEMLLGAGAMQEWDISILNKQGHTTVKVGRDMNDPCLTEID